MYLKILIKLGLLITFTVLFFSTNVWQETVISIVGVLVTLTSLIRDKVDKELLSDIAKTLTYITVLILVVLTKDVHAKIMYVSLWVIYTQLLNIKEDN
jgi:hypothetical protein|nr:MAG TPA: hypothetical protein [Caudoviricetes sp.]